MSHELNLKQMHHGYLGLALLLVGQLGRAPLFVVLGAILVFDDLLQHTVQYLTQSEWHSPVRRLFDVAYARLEFVRRLTAWFDQLFKAN